MSDYDNLRSHPKLWYNSFAERLGSSSNTTNAAGPQADRPGSRLSPSGEFWRHLSSTYLRQFSCCSASGYPIKSARGEMQQIQQNQQASVPPSVDFTMVEMVKVIGSKQPHGVKTAAQKSATRHSVSWWAGGLLFINAALGVGTLHMPYAFFEGGGIVATIVAQMVVMALLFMTMIGICFCADISGESTYGGMMGSLCGPVSRWLAASCVALSTFGVCVAYLVIIGDQYDRLFQSLLGNDFCDKIYLSRDFTVTLTAFVLILPICFVERIDLLKWICSLGVMVMLYPACLTTLFYYGFGETWVARDQRITGEAPIDNAGTSLAERLTAISLVIPALCFSYQSHEVVVSVYARFRHRNIRQVSIAAAFCMIVLLLVYSLTGVFGYLAFGDEVRDDVMLNFDASSPVVLIGVSILIIKAVTSYPLMLICGRECLEVLIRELSTDYSKREPYLRRIITVVWFLLSLLCTLLISDLSTAIEIVGILSFANIFVFPGMCLFQVARQHETFGVRHPVAGTVMGVTQMMLGVVLAATFCLNKFVWPKEGNEFSPICISAQR